MRVTNLDKFIFDPTIKGQDKVDYIKGINDGELEVSLPTMLRIIRECADKDSGNFWIKSARRAGNDWNSTVEFLYESNGKPMICLYVQASSTDSSSCDSIANFIKGNGYRGYCHNLDRYFTYTKHDVCNVVKCILCEYIYVTDIEKAELDKAKKVAELLHYSIINPVLDKFYDKLGPRHVCLDWTPKNRDLYYGGETAIKEYVNAHYKELEGKTNEELQFIYINVFNDYIKKHY